MHGGLLLHACDTPERGVDGFRARRMLLSMDNELQTTFAPTAGLGLAARVEAARQLEALEQAKPARSPEASARWAEVTADYSSLATQVDALAPPTSGEADALYDIL